MSNRARCGIASVLFVAACARRPVPLAPPLPLPPPPIVEEEIKAVEKPNIGIVDLNETPSEDRRTVTVTGTLVNRGTGTTHEVYVHVEALERNGAVLVSADSDPTTELIAPGSTAHFSVVFENRADVDRYHVEAISR
jgi:hypothetical protein